MDIKKLLKNLKNENKEIECKRCKNSLPKDIWPTYSSFANTDGGFILLGVSEFINNGKKSFEVTGVDNPGKVCDELWMCLENPNKVSKNVLRNEDVEIQKIENKNVIIIKIMAVSYKEKPIYINDVINNAYIRLNSADIKINKEQLTLFLRNQNTSQDENLLKNYMIERDIDLSSVEKYKQCLYDRLHDEKILSMNVEDFLIYIGASHLDYDDNKYYLTDGGLLFFGKINSIISRFPHFHLDYFDKRGDNPRWIDRVASDDLSFQNLNLMNYFFLIMEKLRATIEEPFELEDNLIRKSSEKLLITLREAVINMIIHADYYINTTSIFIKVYDTYYEFNNPGMMLVSKKEFIRGGKSCPRNIVLTTLARRLGLSERAGAGGPEIFDFAIKNKFKIPQIETDLKQTNIKIWKIDEVSTAMHPELRKEAKKIFEYMRDNDKISCSAKEIKTNLSIGKYAFDKSMHELISLKLIKKEGKGRSTVYIRTISSLEIYMKLQKLVDEIQCDIIKR